MVMPFFLGPTARVRLPPSAFECLGAAKPLLHNSRPAVGNLRATHRALILLLLAPSISLIAVTLIVRRSAKAQSVEESQQSAVFLVIPVILLVVGQSTGLLLVSAWILLAFGLVCTLLAWLLLKTCMGKFTYETLLQ